MQLEGKRKAYKILMDKIEQFQGILQEDPSHRIATYSVERFRSLPSGLLDLLNRVQFVDLDWAGAFKVKLTQVCQCSDEPKESIS